MKGRNKADRDEAIETIARQRRESVEEVEEALDGYVLGALFRAFDCVDYYAWDADEVLFHPRYGSPYSTGNGIVIRPEAISLRGAFFIDENMEAVPDGMKPADLAQAIIWGSRGGRNQPYYERAESHKRRNRY